MKYKNQGGIRISQPNARPGQTLADHLTNAAAFASHLAEKVGLKEIMKAAGAYHDLGKDTPEFQTYMDEIIAAEQIRLTQGEDSAEYRARIQSIRQKRGNIQHSVHGGKMLYENQQALYIPVAEMLGNIICAHHGSLYDNLSPGGETPLRDKTDKAAEVKTTLPQELFLMNKEAMAAEFKRCCGIMHENDRAFGLSMLTRLMYSILVDADRLDAFLFENKLTYEQAAPDWDGFLKNLSVHLKTFTDKGDMATLRGVVSEGCAKAGLREKGIYKLEVPTGGGKTLSSLRFALEHAKRRGMDRIVYVIPYLSILSQTAGLIREALQADDSIVLEHHSGFLSDEEENYKLHTNRWDAPVILTTQVQFLESVFSAKAADLRKLHNMANSVIIFDEAQSLPVKCLHMFNGAVNFLRDVCGGTVLLCTATQPNLGDVERPIRYTDTKSIVSFPQPPDRTRIVNTTVPGGYSYPELAAFVLDKHQKAPSVLVIVNTKAAARELYAELIKADAPVLHLSTNMCSAHRDNVIETLKERLKAKESVICVSTQLIEAGVDISFECAIRDMAGLDSIWQAAGRCNRHGEFGMVKPVYVVNIAGENLDKLKDIKVGADITGRLFAEHKEEDMDEYYRLYFHVKKNEMDYPVDKGFLYDWLSFNNAGRGAYPYVNGPQGKPAPLMPSAIRSAADEFFVIDRGRVDVVVPYENSENILNEYSESKDITKRKALLKLLGKYSVSLYKYQVDALDGKGALYCRDGIICLMDGFYNKDRGLDLDGNHIFLNV